MRRWLGVLVICCAIVLPLPAAEAHMGPAQPPEFGTPQCIIVADKRTTPKLHLPYGLPFDDTEPEPDKITLPDSKTHQFFAFRGRVVELTPEWEFWPATATEHVVLPFWINDDDLKRADMANAPTIAPNFRAADIGQDFLLARSDIAGQWVEVSTGPARRPITVVQAMLGLYWDLTNVPAGAYQIVSYTFSPPYNGWEPRPGVIKVVDGTVDTPAVTMEPIDDILYVGHGRRLSGCVDTPAGSTLSSWFRVEGTGEWQPWLTSHPVTTGPLDLCFVNPDPATSGMLRLRVAVRAPDGTETFAFSPDVTTQLNTQPGPCTDSATRCCLATGKSMPDPTMEPMAAMPGMMPGAPSAAAGMAMPQMAAAGSAAPTPPPVTSDGGCSATGGGDTPVLAQLALILALCAWRRRRSAH